ncbi:polycystin-1-like protein 3 [Branchiostoma floridae x Branchiostoma belcheri]
MTSVMVVPVALVPAKLFRVEAPTSIVLPEIQQTSTYGLSRDRLSRWSKYVAWVFVAMVSVVSSFFVILYSLDWGKEKSEAWLKTFFLSFGLSSIVAETGKILLLAAMFALVCSKTSSNRQRTYIIKKQELQGYLLRQKGKLV